MRILHVISSAAPESGGPIEGVKQLGKEIHKHGWSSEVVCMDSPDAEYIANFPLKLHALGPKVSSYAYSSKLRPWLLQNAHNYSIIIVNGIWQFHSFTTWLTLSKLKKPYLLFTHGMLDPWFKINYPFKHIKKLIYWLLIEKRVLKGASAVLFTCQQEKILAAEPFPCYEVNPEVVSYGTKQPPTDKASYASKFLDSYPHLKGKRLFLFLSRIHEKKGCDLLIQAFAKLTAESSDLHLVMAGPKAGSYYERLKIMCDDLNLNDRVTWTGMLQGDDKWAAYHASEVFVLPSHQENFGIVVSEALGCGVPVLISNKVNIWKEVEDYKAGLICENTTDGALEVMRDWLALDTTTRRAMNDNAYQLFDEKFTIEGMSKSIMDVVVKYSKS